MATEELSLSDDFDPGPPPSTILEVRLTDDQVNQFHRDGFTSVERITTDEELDWIRPIYDHLFATKGTFKGGYFDLSRPYESDGLDLVPQVLSPELRFPQLNETNAVRNGAPEAVVASGIAGAAIAFNAPIDSNAGSAMHAPRREGSAGG